jgi:hypothetical protein
MEADTDPSILYPSQTPENALAVILVRNTDHYKPSIDSKKHSGLTKPWKVV